MWIKTLIVSLGLLWASESLGQLVSSSQFNTSQLPYALTNIGAISNITVSGTTTLNGVAKLNAASNSTTIVNLGLDANGFVVSNAVPVGAAGANTLWVTNAAGGITNNSPSVRVNGALVGTNILEVGGTSITASNTVQFDTPQLAKAFQTDTNGNTYIGGKLTVSGSGPNILYGDSNQTNAIAVSVAGTQITNGISGVLFSATKGSVNFSNATVSRVAWFGVDHDLTNVTASGNNIVAADGTSATAAYLPKHPGFYEVPIGSFMTNGATSPASLTTLSNITDFAVFTDAVTNTMRIMLHPPANWDQGTIAIEGDGTSTGTNSVSATNWVVGFRFVQLTNAADVTMGGTITFGTEVMATNHIGTNAYLMGHFVTGAATVGGTLNGTNPILCEVRGLRGHASDVATNTSVGLFGSLKIHYFYYPTNTALPSASP